MNSNDILTCLKKKTSYNRLKFPESITFESDNGILKVTMTQNGLKENMQENPAAFEGWVLAIKAIAPELANEVKIQWKGDDATKNNVHYIRFIYRVIKFTQSYKWASYKTLNKQAEKDIEQYKKEICEWVVNYPQTDAKKEAEKGEAQLERSINSLLPGIHDHQLPVGLFFKEISRKTERTPRQGSQIDLWSIETNTLSIYELKKDNNTNVGIISELMFYVNVIKDLAEETLHYPKEAKEAKFRNIDSIYDHVTNKKIKQVYGVFLANNFHPLIQTAGKNLFALLNENTRGIKYKQMGFKISELYDINQ